MKAKIEDERKKLKDVKNMAEEEKNKIKYELKRLKDISQKYLKVYCKETNSYQPLRLT